MERIKLKIKPQSTDETHLEQHFESARYQEWIEQVCKMLPSQEQLNIDFNKSIGIHVDVWFQRRSSDLDNIWKPLLDAMQKAFPDFNDNKVVLMSGCKRVTSDESKLGYLIKIANTTEFD